MRHFHGKIWVLRNSSMFRRVRSTRRRTSYVHTAGTDMSYMRHKNRQFLCLKCAKCVRGVCIMGAYNITWGCLSSFNTISQLSNSVSRLFNSHDFQFLYFWFFNISINFMAFQFFHFWFSTSPFVVFNFFICGFQFVIFDFQFPYFDFSNYSFLVLNLYICGF